MINASILKYFGKCLFTGTVPLNKNYPRGTVPVNKNYPTGTVPVNKNYPTVTVSVNKNCPTGSVINKLAISSSMGVSVWRLQIGLILLKEGVTRAFQ